MFLVLSVCVSIIQLQAELFLRFKWPFSYLNLPRLFILHWKSHQIEFLVTFIIARLSILKCDFPNVVRWVTPTHKQRNPVLLSKFYHPHSIVPKMTQILENHLDQLWNNIIADYNPGALGISFHRAIYDILSIQLSNTPWISNHYLTAI